MRSAQNILAIVQNDLQLIFTLRRFLESHDFTHLNVARNGQEAILYLRGVGIYENRFRYPLPSVLILDAANKDGADLEVLSWVRERAAFRDLPVIILCAEKHALEHITCMLDSSSYLVNRASFNELLDALLAIDAGEPVLSAGCG